MSGGTGAIGSTVYDVEPIGDYYVAGTAPRVPVHGTFDTLRSAVPWRPEFFALALIDSGLLDMLRLEKIEAGTDWVGEFGTAADPSDFEVLHSYSPLHHAGPGVPYPATLVSVGLKTSGFPQLTAIGLSPLYRLRRSLRRPSCCGWNRAAAIGARSGSIAGSPSSRTAGHSCGAP